MDFKFRLCYYIPMRYLILILLLTGCADNTSSFNRTYPKRPEIMAAMNNLLILIPKCNIDRSINIVFDKDVGITLNQGVLGRCIRTQVTKIHDITLSRHYYDYLKNASYYIEMLVIHELGHCQYGLDHAEGTIMAPYTDYIYASDQIKINLMKQFEASHCGE